MSKLRTKGITAALSSAIFFGMAPVFGKKAILLGASPLTVVATRTILAALLLLILMAIFRPRYLYIYPAGLLGCLLAGWINGIGSLFFYSSLGRIDAGVGLLLYSLYPLFVALWMFLDRQPPSRLTLFRLGLTIPAVYLLIQTGTQAIDLVGVLQMLVGAALYALHLPINQRVLYDMPAPTVAVYTLLAMSAVLLPTFFFSPVSTLPQEASVWMPMIGLTVVTFLSRLTLFLGVKHLGGMQTAILGLSEVLVTLLLAYVWLGEQLSGLQWLGAALLGISLILISMEKTLPQKDSPGGWLSWLSHPTISNELPWHPHD
ncbi:MAG: DMT family transporter [Anaerolineae bacterium]|nr:DMT family transporter [Anaerolineae bacterium]MBL6965228.1 DMT family transporter [Anaerolineales bacterium]